MSWYTGWWRKGEDTLNGDITLQVRLRKGMTEKQIRQEFLRAWNALQRHIDGYKEKGHEVLDSDLLGDRL